MKVKRCFGKYGSIELEKIVFEDGIKKKILNCSLLCQDYSLCSLCYWKWYFLNKKRRINQSEFIEEFMNKKRLKFKDANYRRNFKKYKV